MFVKVQMQFSSLQKANSLCTWSSLHRVFKIVGCFWKPRCIYQCQRANDELKHPGIIYFVCVSLPATFSQKKWIGWQIFRNEIHTIITLQWLAGKLAQMLVGNYWSSLFIPLASSHKWFAEKIISRIAFRQLDGNSLPTLFLKRV